MGHLGPARLVPHEPVRRLDQDAPQEHVPRSDQPRVGLPLAAGFGISTPEQAGAVAKMADGVVVGSAIVRQIEKDRAALESLARSLSERMKK